MYVYFYNSGYIKEMLDSAQFIKRETKIDAKFSY